MRILRDTEPDIRRIVKLPIRELVKRFHSEGHSEEGGSRCHRYRSWEHCYAHFQEAGNRRTDEKSLQWASLHLGFYLASWGMYRPSSFLLQKDYFVHTPVVKCLFAPEHQRLWSCDDLIKKRDGEFVGEVATLVSEVKKAYLDEFRNSHEGRIDKTADDVSDTLVTKVLLGTMGCCPAYDRYFVDGSRGRIKPLCFNAKSLNGIIGFIGDNLPTLLQIQEEFAESRGGVRYPLMKLVDMCFWQKGYEEDKAQEGG